MRQSIVDCLRRYAIPMRGGSATASSKDLGKGLCRGKPLAEEQCLSLSGVWLATAIFRPE